MSEATIDLIAIVTIAILTILLIALNARSAWLADQLDDARRKPNAPVPRKCGRGHVLREGARFCHCCGGERVLTRGAADARQGAT